MRLLLAITAAAFAVVGMPHDDAAAQSRGARPKKAKLQQVRVERRTSSVGANGLCQRDTGTPTSALNFRNKCDTEEFWRRTMERGGSGER